MLNPRILIVLSGYADADALTDGLLDALAHAGRPYSLRFAVPAPMINAARGALDALPKAALPRDGLIAYDEALGLEAVAPLLTNETHFLSLEGPCGFGDRWERALLSRLALTGEPRALLTGVLRGQGAEAQAFLPAVAEDFDTGGARLTAGLPLVHSAAPVRTMIAYPALLFGRVDFLREAETARATLSIAAHVAGYTVFALDQTPLWPLTRQPRARLQRPSDEALPLTHLTRFERLAGISYAQERVSARSQLGLFTTEDGYPQRLPRRMEAEQRVRRLSRRAPAPLTVTAFCDWYPAPREPIRYLIRFSYLKALAALPLLLYTGGEQERALRARFANTLAYPDNGVLPRKLIYQDGMTQEQHFRRSKWLLLRRAMHAWPEDTHAAGVDIDILPHPVPPGAALDFSPLMDDRVHLGWVDGAPDASMIVAPRERVRLLAREAESITLLDAELKRGFSERALLLRLIDAYPDLFTLHPLPKRELLPLTLLDARLLSVELRRLLSALPPPVHAEDMKERKPT